MSPESSSGGGAFFPGMLGDLLKMMRTDNTIQWDLAVQFAQSVASDQSSEANVDPTDRIALETLVGLAERHVADVTGMTLHPTGRALALVASNRSDWAKRSLKSWRSLVEAITGAISPPTLETNTDEEDESDAGGDQLQAFFAQWASVIAPTMLAMQIGSAVGHLAQRCLGQYELPLPRGEYTDIAVVPSNIRSFAQDWSLSFDDVAIWSMARDITIHAILSRPHVASRLRDLLISHTTSVRPDTSALEQLLGDQASIDLSDISGLAGLFGDPSALRELAETDEQHKVHAELGALSSAIDGYADWVASNVAPRTSGAALQVREAMRRHRIERDDEARGAEALFGLSLDQNGLDRGEAFVRGVLDRGGEVELAKLWVVEANLPTPAEVDAPGLWIERVNLPPLDEA